MRGLLAAVLALIGTTGFAADPPKRDVRAIEKAVAVQVLLDRANFGPGKIDGHLGDFTKKALDRYRQVMPAQSQPVAATSDPGPAPGSTAAQPSAETSRAPAEPNPEAPRSAATTPASDHATPTPPASRAERPASREDRGADEKPVDAIASETDLAGLDLASVSPVFIEYTVTEADAQAVGELPKTPEQKAKLKWLPYASIGEAVAERYHMDLDFLEELNPGKTKNLRVGDVVKVPNVEPFELSNVKDLKPGSAGKGANAEEPAEVDEQTASKAKDDDAKKEKKKDTAKTEKSSDAKKADEAPSTLKVVISKDENMLEVFDRDRMIAAFPVTVGSSETASPIGEWKVRGVAKLPEFRWDEKMLKQGERSDDFHLLPPGPNSPVGVIWIALNKKGVGIHGSDSPDAIGRNVSHGCIRLANWDVVKLAAMVKGGVPVTIR